MAELDLRGALKPRGVVVAVGDGVAQVVGLAGVGSEELVAFDGGALGIASDLGRESTGVVLLKGTATVCAGAGAVASGMLPALPTGDELLGRVVDPLGAPLDGGPAPRGAPTPIFLPAPPLVARAPVQRPLHTGVMAVDASVPIGRGQRQLIIGDRNVGKTALAIDIVAAQRQSGVRCVYVVIGQPLTRVLQIRQALHEHDALAHTVIVAADAADAPGLQHIAPYAGAAVAEAFRAAGADALVVYDDLTKHADAYRELALLLGRSPGREAYPGDIFYVHAELLERATAFADAAGGGSVTAFAIVETTDGDVSSYIPTNLISITDGQLYLDAARFERNERPAIDVGKSVSRVGGAAQTPAMRAAAKSFRIDLARFEALESLTRIGLDVDSATLMAVRRGRLLRALQRQPRFTIRSVAEQIFAIAAVRSGALDATPPERVRDVVDAAIARARGADADAAMFAALDRGDADVVKSDAWRALVERAVHDEVAT